MPSSEVRTPNYGRRIIWLAVAIIVLFGGYSIGWFYLANKVEAEAAAAIAKVNRDGVTAECGSPTARGFPFRIGLYCDRVAYADARQGVGFTAGGFRSAGQIYDPMRLVGELDGPANLTLPDGNAFDFDWDNLRASARLSRPLPELVSLEGRMLRAGRAPDTPLVTANLFELHFRPNGKDVDLAGSFAGLAIDPSLVQGKELPLLGGQSDITITDGASLLADKVKSLRGRSVTIRTLSLSSGKQTGIVLSGPASVDEDGLLNANLNITIHDPKDLGKILGDILPEKRSEIESALSALAMLGNAPSLPLKITRGKASIAFVKLGRIPPVD
jgi:hypothetical protein